MTFRSAKLWTPEDEAELHRLLALGVTQVAIAQHLGCHRKRITNKIKQIAERKPGASPVRSSRRCLGCGNPFSSQGAHNRLCHSCQGRSVSPYAP